ncbi:hypothetical protein [Teichococcus deserti]|uniref:TubC N-terminal docking domain-related protein n=1 Tax=Teichococcus deserti TaxID=1817963 RepID=UPI00105450B6|nr:hypothetical protein [Pseudoroseomonas deserti]
MTPSDLLNLCAQSGITLWLQDGRVKLQAEAPPPADLLQELRTRRAEITAFLEHCDAVDAAEAEAIREHFAAPSGPGPPSSDPLKDGLRKGFWAHRHIHRN